MVDSEEVDGPRKWSELLNTFTLEQVRIVATLGSDGGAIVENLRKLVCDEGRRQTFQFGDDRDINALEYVFAFASSEEAPDRATASEARIVITGRHGNGLRMEIRGDGLMGYDNAGNVDGLFEVPPVILIEDDEPDDDPPEPEADPFGFEFPMPPQYTQATTRFPPRDD